VSYGHPRLHVLLRREGWVVNHKRSGRLYREEGLQLGRRRGPKRRKAVMGTRPLRAPVERPNTRWAMDKHLPLKDVAAAGGWQDVETLLECYQQPDHEMLKNVMDGARTLHEAPPVSEEPEAESVSRPNLASQ